MVDWENTRIPRQRKKRSASENLWTCAFAGLSSKLTKAGRWTSDRSIQDEHERFRHSRRSRACESEAPTPSHPSPAAGCRTVVSGGYAMLANSISSKPIETSSGSLTLLAPSSHDPAHHKRAEAELLSA